MSAAVPDEIRVLAPTAILGYGFPEASWRAGVARRPHVVAVDAGSTDPGPYYLGAGRSFTDAAAVARDLRLIVGGAAELGVPVVVGTAGGAGADAHLELTAGILAEVVADLGLTRRVTLVGAEVARDDVLAAWRAGRVRPLPPGPEATAADVAGCTRIVAQMGLEPLVAALDGDPPPDVVLAGRAYDPAVFAAWPVRAGADPGLALHLGKILECAAIAAVPGSGADCMLGTLRADHFDVEPVNPARACTTASVAGHTLYEKSDPVRLPGPGGHLDLGATTFEQVDARTVRVRGSRFVPDAAPALKLEGAVRVGYRTVSIAGARDPRFVAALDDVERAVRDQLADLVDADPSRYRFLVHVYGRDAVLGPAEPARDTPAHEVGIVLEAVADTPELADTVCGLARSTMLHLGYPGRTSTAGNLAIPYSPSDLRAGEVYRFGLYHLLDGADPVATFPRRTVVMGR